MKRRRRFSDAVRSSKASSIWPSMELSAPPRRPTSVRGSSFSTRCERSPPAMAAAVVLDPAEWPQADADEPEAEEEHRGEHRGGDRQLDDQQLVQRVVGLVQRCGDDEELVRVPDRLELHAEAGVASTASTVKGPPAAAAAVALDAVQIGLGQRRLAGARPGRGPAGRSRWRRRRRRGPGWRMRSPSIAPSPAPPCPCSSDCADRLGARPGPGAVDAVDEERAQLLVRDDARDDRAPIAVSETTTVSRRARSDIQTA